MTKKVTGGTLSDQAAAVLDELSKRMPRGQAVSLALEDFDARHGITINQHSWFNGWFSYNNWAFRLVLAIRARMPKLSTFDEIPWPAWVLVGAIGATYFFLMLFGGR